MGINLIFDIIEFSLWKQVMERRFVYLRDAQYLQYLTSRPIQLHIMLDNGY